MKGDAFANPRRKNETEAFWRSLQATRKAADSVRFAGTHSFKPDVAVFVDDHSPARSPLLGPPGVNNYKRAELLYGNAIEQISASGVVFREYLLSDLSSDLIDLSHVRLAVFLNAFEIPNALRSHISNKLEKDGRSLLFIYAAGSLNEVGTLNPTSMRELLGFEVRRGDTALPGPVQCNVRMDNIQVSFGLPDDGSWDPWFFVYDHSAEILGTYSNGKASLACCDKGTHKTYYSALPGLPKDIYRAIARRSGVHFFSSVPTDQVELRGKYPVIDYTTCWKSRAELTF